MNFIVLMDFLSFVFFKMNFQLDCVFFPAHKGTRLAFDIGPLALSLFPELLNIKPLVDEREGRLWVRIAF